MKYVKTNDSISRKAARTSTNPKVEVHPNLLPASPMPTRLSHQTLDQAGQPQGHSLQRPQIYPPSYFYSYSPFHPSGSVRTTRRPYRLDNMPVISSRQFFTANLFQSSTDLGTSLATWIRDLIETEEEMGKVITIDALLYRSTDGAYAPGHQAVAYVKGTRTLADVGLAKSCVLPGNKLDDVVRFDDNA
ncbi:hypothetical protein BGZ95_011802 [Linnemannia exigua]|uniref:Uncharacterized protein n=1 Tax=Linnemannia exigua TaxID=604196 RepID=A0AAD4D9E7_9FUNG|nr:hypothetical protein BGZ95_011802 [Linnemannia exigua]